MTDGLTLRFLGSGDAFGSGGRLQTCLALEAAGVRALIDCGASSLIGMKRFGVDPAAIDTILISHLHGDHFGGLPFVILDAQLVSRRTRPLTIAGPPGIADRTRAAMEVLFPGSSRVQQKFAIEFIELADRVRTPIGPIAVTPFEVVHASGAPPYALRVEIGGRTVVYSGDTEWTEALIGAARGADLFVCEAYYFDKPIKFHLSYATLRDRRADLACRRLILTHLSADLLARTGDLDCEWATDGLTLTL